MNLLDSLDTALIEARQIPVTNSSELKEKLDEIAWLLVFSLVNESNIKMAKQVASRAISDIRLINEKPSKGEDPTPLLTFLFDFVTNYVSHARTRLIMKN